MIEQSEMIEMIESSFIDSKSEEIGTRIISVAHKIHVLLV